MGKIFIARFGEIVLKGNNRHSFESTLLKNIKYAVSKYGKFNIYAQQSIAYIEPIEGINNYDEVADAISKVFGLVSLSEADVVENDLNQIQEKALEHIKNILGGKKDVTFKVETKRGNKTFPMNSIEISTEVGGYILSNIPSLKVDVHNPEITVYVEVREKSLIHSKRIPCAGGLPLGTNGKATLLLSGGIDSPVAGYMVAKRGVVIDAVHFYSYPYTSERAKDKVIDLAKILASYCGKVNLHVVPFTEIQLLIHEKCPEEQMTLIMRRFMMKIAEKIALRENSNALVTGESLGQVASQTIQSLHVTNEVVSMPVLRPLIGMDKVEIIEIARKIGTFETSILPYEDCCTIFVPKHPRTKPVLNKILLSESHLDVEKLVDDAVNGTETIELIRE